MVLYDDLLRKRITTSIEAGIPVKDIVKSLMCSPELVYKYRRNLRVYGTYNPPTQSVGYRLKKVHLAAQEALKELLDSTRTMMLDEIQDWLLEEWDIEVYTSNISRLLKKMNISYKKVEYLNPEADSLL